MRRIILALAFSAPALAADLPPGATPESKPVVLQMANRETPRVVRDADSFGRLVKATAERDDQAIRGLKAGGDSSRSRRGQPPRPRPGPRPAGW
jgi:hypothetical protein